MPKKNLDDAITVFEADYADIKAVRVMLELARLMAGRSQGAYYRAVGQHLGRIRRRHTAANWARLVLAECGLSRRRAYELMALDGKKTLAEHLAEGRKRARKSRKAHVTHEVQ